MTPRRAAGAALLLALGAGGPAPAAAQLPGILPAGSYVRDVWYPKVFWTPRNGLTAGGYFAFVAPMRYENYDDPPPYAGAVSLDGQASTSGSRYLTLDAFAPALVDGWRFRLTLSTDRRNREGYYGIGNDTEIDPALDALERFYEVRRLRHYARGEVQRRLVGGLRVLAGVHAERWTFDTVTSFSRFGQDLGSTVPPEAQDGTGDLAARVGLVFDTRDSEVAPRRGVLLEGIQSVGEVGGDAYRRTTLSARGYLTLSPRFTVAGRVAGRRMGGTPGLGSIYRFEASDRPFDVLGDANSHRAIPDRRFLGEHVLFGNLDLHVTAFELPTLVRVVLLGYVDAGRVFQNEEFRLTTEGLHWGGGGGVLVHMFRTAVLGVSVGWAGEGTVVQAYTSWPY